MSKASTISPWTILLTLASLLAISRASWLFPIEKEPWPTTKSNYNNSQLALSGHLNINQATDEELSALPGLGAKRAAAIIARRNQKGCFTNINDLLEIRGIGAKSVRKLSDYLFIGPCPAADDRADAASDAS